MACPLLTVIQSDYLIQVVDTNLQIHILNDKKCRHSLASEDPGSAGPGLIMIEVFMIIPGENFLISP